MTSILSHSNENVHTLGRLLSPPVSQGADRLVRSKISQKSPFFTGLLRLGVFPHLFSKPSPFHF